LIFVFGKVIDCVTDNIGNLWGKVTFARFYWRRIGFTLGGLLDKITRVVWLTRGHLMTFSCKIRQEVSFHQSRKRSRLRRRV